MLRNLISPLLNPLPLFWLLLIIGMACYLLKKNKIAKTITILSVAWLMIISTPLLPKALLSTLEDRYPPVLIPLEATIQATLSDSSVHILVLGSGYTNDTRLPYLGQLNSSGLGRLNEGIRLHNQLPKSMLIFSGYKGDQPIPQAEAGAFAAKELGIPSQSILTIPEPWNTRNEALEYYKRFGKSHKLYLVTDAAHMPRAMLHFRNAGLQPIAAPTNFMIKKNKVVKKYYQYFPSSENIKFMEIVFHEYLGMMWAKLGGD
jgi:uncharacterized SAM-binding protein YcdF (DUF218 family)